MKDENDLREKNTEVMDGPLYGKADRSKTKATTMTIRDMAELLGIKKTDSYWLVHKGGFKVTELYGQMRIDRESFEKWYANQTTYRKRTGEEPGGELRAKAYTALELADLLGIQEKYIYEVLKKEGLEYQIIDHQKWFPKDAFEEWYRNQSRYRTGEDRAREQELMDSTMSMPEMAEILDIPRNIVYSILKSKKQSGVLKVVWLQGRRRVTRESFDKWYRSQKRYRKPEDRTKRYKGKHWHYVNKVKETKAAEEEKKRAEREKTDAAQSRNPDYLSVYEAAELAHMKPSTIKTWMHRKEFVFYTFNRKRTLIERKSFEEWLEKKGGRHGDDRAQKR
ncbi:MAG: helix-turn-helix domain-containing protein [Eubacterium sp.]|nr:helix-turn-helix domain-containing protein [Eubacterium sp.]